MPRTSANPRPLIARHVAAIEQAAEALWANSKYGRAAAYTNTTWNGPERPLTEELREFWRGEARIVIDAYKWGMR